MGFVVRLVIMIITLGGLYLAADPTIGSKALSCGILNRDCGASTEAEPAYELEFVGLVAEDRTIDEDPPALLPLRRGERGGRRLWALSDEYAYCHDETQELILVPRGFVTDLTSIPSLARVIYNPADYAEAALVHDYLYAVGASDWRPNADEVFRAILIETNHSRRRAEVLFRAVRIGGNGGYGLADDWLFWDLDEREFTENEPKPEDGPVFDDQC